MKNTLVLSFLLILSHGIFGQDLISQDDIAAKWLDGSYASRNVNSGMWEPMASGKDDIKFIKGESGKITVIQIGSTSFKANVSKSSPFVDYYYNSYDRLYLTEATIIQYYDNNTTKEADPKKFWGKKPKGVGAISKEITAFLAEAEKIIDAEKENFAAAEAEAQKKAEEARRKQYGLEGKNVSSIEIVNLKTPEKFGHFRGFEFDIVATLSDGTKISTQGYTEGYISDYTISYSASNYDGKLNSGFVANDKITITATSKYHPGVSAKKEVTVLYNEDISFNYNGRSWSRGAGEPASSYRIEVKQVKHASNGTDVLMIRILDSNGSAVVSEFKMRSNQTLHFFAKGGNGGSDDGTGSNGGDGGNITVIKDPSVKEFNLEYHNEGGRGGSGLTVSASGRDGRNGQYKEEVRKVSF